MDEDELMEQIDDESVDLADEANETAEEALSVAEEAKDAAEEIKQAADKAELAAMVRDSFAESAQERKNAELDKQIAELKRTVSRLERELSFKDVTPINDLPDDYTHEQNDSEEPDGEYVGSTYPRIVSLDISKTASIPDEFKNWIQDYQLYEKAILNPNTIGKEGDRFFPFWQMKAATELTSKDYARIDSHNSTAWTDCAKSLELTTNFLQVAGFFAAVKYPAAPATLDHSDFGAGDDKLLVLAHYGNQSDTGAVMKYVDLNVFKAADADTADIAESIEGASGRHDHENHNFHYDDHDGSATGGTSGSPARYLTYDGGVTRNYCTSTMYLGDLAKASIYPYGRILYDDTGTAATGPSVAWNDRILYDDTGIQAVINWNATGWTARFSATNIWSATGFDFNVTDDASFTTTNDLAMSIGAGSVWVLPALTIQTPSDGSGAFICGTGATRWSTMNFAATVSAEITTPTITFTAGTAVYLGPTVGGLANLYFNGVAGVDLTNWTTKGGLTGSSVARKRIRTINADTGLEMDIEVLGIAI